jgi:hypothetical protein
MVIASVASIEVNMGNVTTRLDTTTKAAKQAAFDRLHDWLRGLAGEHDIRREISALYARHGGDEAAVCRDLRMSWDELKSLAGEPLITVGAGLARRRLRGQRYHRGRRRHRLCQCRDQGRGMGFVVALQCPPTPYPHQSSYPAKAG